MRPRKAYSVQVYTMMQRLAVEGKGTLGTFLDRQAAKSAMYSFHNVRRGITMDTGVPQEFGLALWYLGTTIVPIVSDDGSSAYRVDVDLAPLVRAALTTEADWRRYYYVRKDLASMLRMSFTPDLRFEEVHT